MTKELKVFDYEGAQVRTVEIDGEIWFVAKDVCDILEYKNVTQTLDDYLDNDERSIVSIGQVRQNRNMNIINEPGLYKLIFGSSKPQAKAFTRWVTHEVLPQIRKTGCFEGTAVDPKLKLPAHSGIIKAAEKIIDKVFTCKEEEDYQAVLALDKVFKETFGRSALEMANIKLVSVRKDIMYYEKEEIIYTESKFFSKWRINGDPHEPSFKYETDFREFNDYPAHIAGFAFFIQEAIHVQIHIRLCRYKAAIHRFHV